MSLFFTCGVVLALFSLLFDRSSFDYPKPDYKKIANTFTEFELNRFHQAARNLSEEGQNNIRILRGWAKSKGWVKVPNSGGPEKVGNFTEWGIQSGEWYVNPFTARSGVKQLENIFS